MLALVAAKTNRRKIKQKQKLFFLLFTLFFLLIIDEKFTKSRNSTRDLDHTKQALVHSTNTRSFLSERRTSEWIIRKMYFFFLSVYTHTHIYSCSGRKWEREREKMSKFSRPDRRFCEYIVGLLVSERESNCSSYFLAAATTAFVKDTRVKSLSSSSSSSFSSIFAHPFVLTEKLNMKNHLSTDNDDDKVWWECV